MSLTKKVAHNTLIQIIGKIISTILGLFVIAFITRYLGRTGFGQYTTIITFLGFFAIMADFGLTLVTVQMISGERIAENKILNNLFGFRLTSGLFFLILAPLTVFFFPYSLTIKLGVIITFIAFLFPALNQIIIGLFQKKLSMERNAVAEVASRIVLLLGVIATEKFQFGLTGILLSTVASTLTSFIFNYLFSLKFTTIKPAFDWLIWKKIITKSWPLAITIVLNLIYLRADILLLSLFRSEAEVGLYGATYKIVDVLTAIPFMFAGLILPILSKAWSKNNQKYFRHVLQKSFDFMAILTIPLLVGAQFLSRSVMSFVGGAAFAASGIILQVLIFAVGAVFLGTIFSHAIIALNKQKTMIGFYVFTSVTSLIAYLILIPRFSYLGAAAVTIYSEVLIAIFSAYCVWKYSKFLPQLKIMFKSIISGLVMGAFLYFFTKTYQTTLGGLSLLIIVSSLIYFLALFLLKGIKRQDLATVLKHQDKNIGPSYHGPQL